MREFKYYPEDFGDLKVKVRHMELHFDIFEDHTVVSSRLDLTALEDLTVLDLNARGLEILEVSDPFDYLESEDVLRLNFGREIRKGTDFSVATKTICRPTAHDLEGLYYDETPAGCPRQQITQCQQWGFQRIVPCIDDMTAKCTYRTTLVADGRYTNYLSNGDVVEGPEALDDGRVRVVYDNLVTRWQLIFSFWVWALMRPLSAN
jgi:aminopeptidase N